MEQITTFFNDIDTASYVIGTLSCMMFNCIFSLASFLLEKAFNEKIKRRKNKIEEKEKE